VQAEPLPQPNVNGGLAWHGIRQSSVLRLRIAWDSDCVGKAHLGRRCSWRTCRPHGQRPLTRHARANRDQLRAREDRRRGPTRCSSHQARARPRSSR